MRRKARLEWAISCAAFLGFLSLGGSADACVFSGPRYQLMADTVSWKMTIGSGQTCVRGFRFNDVQMINVKLLSPPRSGQVILLGPGFSYTAKADFRGTDSFAIAITGSIKRVFGSSTIHIDISVTGEPSVLAPAARLPISSASPPSPAVLMARSIVSPAAATRGTGSWQPLKIGGGGYVTGQSIASDGTKVIRTDTYGGYVWTGSSWAQLVTSNSMPPGDWGINKNAAGLYEIVVCSGNSNVAYMMPADGFIYRTANLKSGSLAMWTKTNFGGVNGGVGSNAHNRGMGKFAACDANNTAGNVIYFGSPSNGVWSSMDGGNSWTYIAAVGNASSSGNSLIAIDYQSSVSGSGSDAVTQGVYISTYGTGLYYTSNGGVSWALTNGGSGTMPTTHSHLIVDQNGAAWLVDASTGAGGNGTINKYSGGGASGTWSQKAPSGAGSGTANNTFSIAIDPTNANNIVVSSAGSAISYSTDGLDTITNLQFSETVTGDQPWSSQPPRTSNVGLSISDIVYDPSQPGTVSMSEGFGTLYFNPSLSVRSSSVTLNTVATGIEQLVGTAVLAPPNTSNVVLGSEDFPIAYKPSTSFNQNLDATRPTYVKPFGTLAYGYSLDYAPERPSKIVGVLSGNIFYNYGVDYSGISTDGGNTWTKFSTIPAHAGSGNTIGGGGNIAAASTNNFVWIPYGTGSIPPYYTIDGGNTWTAGTGVSGQWVGTGYIIARYLVADKIKIGDFYAYLCGSGFYASTNGGAKWSLTSSTTFDGACGFSMILKSSPYTAQELVYSSGWRGGSGNTSRAFLYISRNGGASWNSIPGFLEVTAFGFGAKVRGQAYASMYAVGWYNNVYGIYQSLDDGSTWTKFGDYPNGNFQNIVDIDGDKQVQGRVYIAINGSGFQYYTP